MTTQPPAHGTAPDDMDDHGMAEALLRDLAAVLDLDAGLHDVLAHDRSDRLLHHLTNVLDLEAGVRAILPPDVVSPVHTQLSATDPGPRRPSDAGDVLGRFLEHIGLLDPVTRLMIRRSAPGADFARDLRRVTNVLDRLAEHAGLMQSQRHRLDRGELARELAATQAEMEELAQTLSRNAEATNLDDWVATTTARNIPSPAAGQEHENDSLLSRALELSIAVLDALTIALDADARNRAHARALDRALDRVRDLARDRARDRALDRALDLALARARARARAIAPSLRHALVDLVSGDLVSGEAPAGSALPGPSELADAVFREARALAVAVGTIHVDTAETSAGRPDEPVIVLLHRLEMAYQRGQALKSVSELLNDYGSADLSSADLNQVVSLDGVRWTESTQWPDGWKAEIDRRSVDIGGGVREIREGVGTHQQS